MAAAAIQGVPLKGNHADHIVPKSKGGSNDITNIRITNPKANMKKSNRLFEPRDWQESFKLEWDKGAKNFLCTVCPAGGKTLAALWVGYNWLRGTNNGKLVIVVPTDNLKKQWQEQAAEWFGLQLKIDEVDVECNEYYDGYCVTYQSVRDGAGCTIFFRLLGSTKATKMLAILDEPHHCALEKSWGLGIREAFEYADRRLLLSGTPYRTDRNPIPYITYKNNVSVADYIYDADKGRADGIVRKTIFAYESGEYSENDHATGELKTYKIDLDVEMDEMEQVRLAGLMNPDGEFVRNMIRRSHDKLTEVRKTIKDAAAMAVCVNQEDAKKTAKVIKELTGCDASIIVSEPTINNDTVDNFRTSTKEWVVSVKQVSEGTDIKRLQVLCYLTNATTKLFFRQLIGRVQRVRGLPHEIDHECYVYLPAHPRLSDNANEYEMLQDQAIEIDNERYLKEKQTRGEYQLRMTSWDSSRWTGTRKVSIDGVDFTADQYHLIQSIATKRETTSEKVAGIMHDFLNAGVIAPPIVNEGVDVEKPKQEKITKLRNSQIYNKVGYIFNIYKGVGLNVPHGHIHAEANKAVGVEKQNLMSLDQLNAKMDYLFKIEAKAKKIANERNRK